MQVSFRPLPPPERPSIAVMPFRDLSDDFDLQSVADSLTDHVIYTLACIGGLFVSGRNSIFTFKGRKVTPQDVGQALGVAHVLDATMTRQGERFAMTAELKQTESGQTLWTQRLADDVDAIFSIQGSIVAKIVETIAPSISIDPAVIARGRVSKDVGIYHKFLVAYSNYTPSSEESSRAMYASLSSIADQLPRHPLPLALMAQCYSNLIAQGWSRDVATDAAAATRLARAALERDDDDPAVLMMAGHALAFLGEDYDAAIDLLDRSLRLNPNSASTYERAGWLRCFTGEPETAAGHFQAAKRQSPLDNATFRFDSGLGLAHCMAGAYDDAVYWLRRSIADTPTWTSSYRILVAALAQLGRTQEMEAARCELLARQPGYRIAELTRPFRPSEGLDRVVEGLRLAGLPE